MTKQVHITIFGDVQGVNFRSFACQKGQELNLTGFARNMPDGTVEVIAQGEKENLEKFCDWARLGPPYAKVERLETRWQEPEKTFESFEIRY